MATIRNTNAAILLLRSPFWFTALFLKSLAEGAIKTYTDTAHISNDKKIATSNRTYAPVSTGISDNSNGIKINRVRSGKSKSSFQYFFLVCVTFTSFVYARKRACGNGSMKGEEGEGTRFLRTSI